MGASILSLRNGSVLFCFSAHWRTGAVRSGLRLLACLACVAWMEVSASAHTTEPAGSRELASPPFDLPHLSRLDDWQAGPARLSPPLSCTRQIAKARQARISIDVRDADLSNVFRMIARVSGQNIVVSDRVQGKVTLRLEQVPWQDALQSVLYSHQLGMVTMGDIIQIDTLDALKTRAEAARSLQDVRQASVSTRLFTLQNAVASDLKPTLESMLSPQGKISVDARTNSLIITDTADKLAKLETLLFGESLYRESLYRESLYGESLYGEPPYGASTGSSLGQ